MCLASHLFEKNYQQQQTQYATFSTSTNQMHVVDKQSTIACYT